MVHQLGRIFEVVDSPSLAVDEVGATECLPGPALQLVSMSRCSDRLGIIAALSEMVYCPIPS